MKDIANFLFETGMLKRTPRSGLQFLGSGKESVAEHSFRVVMIGYTLATLNPGVDENRILKMTLLHDILETRTGDLNYVNKKYLEIKEEKAVDELAGTLPFGEELKGLLKEFREMIELVFSKGYIKILLATETFAIGMNMPTKTVVFILLFV